MSKKAAFEALRAARETGKRDFKVQEAQLVYDEVDEEAFRHVVRNRVREDDFVIDDGQDEEASGYVDNGIDEWEQDRPDEREQKRARREVKAKAKKEIKPSLSHRKPKANIPEGSNPYYDPSKPRQIKPGNPLQENPDDFLQDIIGSLGKNKPIRSLPTKREDSPSNEEAQKKKAAQEEARRVMINRYKAMNQQNQNRASSGAGSSLAPSSDDYVSNALNDHVGMLDFGDGDRTITGIDIDEGEDSDELFQSSKNMVGRREKVVNSNTSKPVLPSVKKEEQIVKIDKMEEVEEIKSSIRSKGTGMNWKTATSGLATAPIPLLDESDSEEAPKEEELLPVPDLLKPKPKPIPKSKQPKPNAAPNLTHVSALEKDGSLKFWWFDYIEPGNGALVLIGKVCVKEGKDVGKYVSGCLMIRGIRRKLYVLPREQEGDESNETQVAEFGDVESNFYFDAEDKWGVKNIQITPEWVKKRYAFGIKGVPREETNWLEVKCDFPGMNDKGERVDIPMNASGEFYSHVFGTPCTPFEMFVLEHKIMGPCWLNIKASTLTKDIQTWTKFEAIVDTDAVSVFKATDPEMPKSVPTLNILSLATRTVVNLKENKREVVCCSARVWQNCDVDNTASMRDQPSSAMTFVRPLFGPYPDGFSTEARTNQEATILPLSDEKALLIQLIALFQRTDPDVIVGHDLSGVELDVILGRLKDLKVEHWSKIGRFWRPRWPKLSGGRNLGLLAGRLVLDLNGDGSRGLIESTTWSLTEMCKTHLDIEREDLDPEDTARFFDANHATSKELLYFLAHCGADSFFQMELAHRVQILPLTRQLTILAGNSWNRTLGGSRAERNEFILLHRFTESGFVCPDKVPIWEKKAQKAAEAKAAKEAAEGADVVVVASKEKFKGGLVFAPKKGLWDRFVLVMDFNSLYPSIIQEYDIDFSTIDWTADDAEDADKMMEKCPCQGEPTGILPQLIASLVQRRKTVKNMMKDKNIDSTKMKQYDITQLALKLTANSMYGCLGFEGSRFYARPLAALTTFKGREILTRTKAEAEGMDLNVIYGDTDSVMINTDQVEYSEAIKMGFQFKKLINSKYRKLEIDTDAVFASMLLLAKKKYAALKMKEDGSTSLEIKGLDMKRREYCELSKQASKSVLGFLMSGLATEDILRTVHEYLEDFGNDIRANRKPMESYIIFKRLGKNPEDYPDSKSQPHVTVALRMKAKGQSAKAGDVIPYIFCVPSEGSQTAAKAANAYHPDDVRRAGSELKIDFQVYLATQILPPIERLCDPIEGTERARLAECLGLDVHRYKNHTYEHQEKEFKTLESQLSDTERFKDCEQFQVTCPHCLSSAIFDGLHNTANLLSPTGVQCINSDCGARLRPTTLAVQLDLQCRAFISKFYEGWMSCDDPICDYRTRMISVVNKRCLKEGCRGVIGSEYTDMMLYNQLLYFDGVLDLTKVKADEKPPTALIEGNEALFSTYLRPVVTRHLDKSARRWVKMDSLFSFLSLH